MTNPELSQPPRSTRYGTLPFDSDKQPCDFPPEAKVVPQLDPVQRKTGKQHEYPTGN
jgi:hypothetical protein